MAIPTRSTRGAEPPRERLRALLSESGREWDVAELSAATGLHPNTLRGHLQILVDLGEVERRPAQDGGPGRPRVLFRIAAVPEASAGDPAGGDPYHRLAAEFAAGMTQVDGDQAAHSAGRAWGERVREQHETPEPLDGVAAARLAARGMTDLGFTASAVQDAEPGDRIDLTACPYRELARTTPSVCHVHAGLLAGMLAELGGVELDRLVPFVEDSLCVAHLRQADGGS